MGEPTAERFEEDAKNTRAEMRRKAALDEIDRAKDQQAGFLKFPNKGESVIEMFRFH